MFPKAPLRHPPDDRLVELRLPLLAGIGKSGPSRPVAIRGCLAARMAEMDGRGGFFVEVDGGFEGFKHQMISVLLRMISEVLNFCYRMMKC